MKHLMRHELAIGEDEETRPGKVEGWALTVIGILYAAFLSIAIMHTLRISSLTDSLQSGADRAIMDVVVNPEEIYFSYVKYDRNAHLVCGEYYKYNIGKDFGHRYTYDGTKLRVAGRDGDFRESWSRCAHAKIIPELS